jgi:hypothetical protein
MKNEGKRSRDARNEVGRALAGALGLTLLAISCEKEQSSPSVSAVSSAPAPVERRSKPSDPTPAFSAASSNPCGAVCERGRELRCANHGECSKRCSEMLATPACRGELLAALSCFAKRPASDWECDADGAASIKDGFCESEQERFATCLERSAAVP